MCCCIRQSHTTSHCCISDATDVSAVPLGSNALPPYVKPVSKRLYLDMYKLISSAKQPCMMKLDGFDRGPQLSDGSYVLVVVSNNELGVDESGESDVCINGLPAVFAVKVSFVSA